MSAQDETLLNRNTAYKTKIWVLLLISCVLFGCQPGRVRPTPTHETSPADETRPEPACNQPGSVRRSELETTTREYPYSFNIYLPPCYALDTDRYYPVIYLIPGRGSGPNTWFAAGADKAADEVILGGKAPPFLIITTETTDSDAYADAIFKDLIPYIESHYRILNGRNYHAVAGGSLGGVAAYRIAFRHPDRFATAAMFGSGLISGEEEQFKGWLQASTPEMMPRVFLNTGEQDPLMLDRARVMVLILDQAGIESTLVVSPGGHDYVTWVANLPAFYTWLARDW